MSILRSYIVIILIIITSDMVNSQVNFETDTIKTKNSQFVISFLGHGTLFLNYNGKVIHVDPVGTYADYSVLPKADIILITHEHGDHLDPEAIKRIQKQGTKIFYTESCLQKVDLKGDVLSNGDERECFGFKIEAVPAYNLVHVRDDGNPYHPKGRGNGYVLTIDDKRIYIAGDTENIPEMKDLKDINIAFLPMNLPYTMTPEMVVESVKLFMPDILYPYHYGKTDTNELISLLKDLPEVDVRVRKMQ